MRIGALRVAMTVGVAVALTGAGTAASAAASSRGAGPMSRSYQLGINSVVYYHCETTAQWDQWALNQAQEVKALGANSIAYLFPFYTSSSTSNDFFGEFGCGSSPYQTPPVSFVSDLVTIAHSVGLQVFLRPELDQNNLWQQDPNDWRGNIHPTDVSLWFQNYLTTLTPYLQMAQQDGVEHFAISTELDSLAYNKNWRLVIYDASTIYHGNLVFTDSWNNLGNLVQWGDTTPGLDTYQPATTATIKSTRTQLLDDWNKLLTTTVPVPFLSSATIDEIGIPAQDGAYAQPNTLSFPLTVHPFNQMIQATWFSMACYFMKEHHMGGIYYLGGWLSTHHGNLLTSPSSALTGSIQPASQRAIRRCFTQVV